LDGVLAIGHEAREQPVTQPADIAAAAVTAAPAEGAA
jgi:hypothetical protein